jgi:HD superfamily phosphohydrolase
MTNKLKIVNDPVHGFINIPSELVFDIFSHPYFQRLRRIKQLGLTEFVYPGAVHTRFHHALGVMHLTHLAVEILRQKNIEITEAEHEGVILAALLHDIGHGPFSHALEYSILQGVSHEWLSHQFIQNLNQQFEQRLTVAQKIFNNTYKKTFLHQLISSQLDTDRLDYLKRDAYFTGVQEGNIGAGRILKMLTVSQQKLVVEEKAIYSIEHFLSARRLMYWQVYMHKTTVATEQMLIQLIKRAKFLQQNNTNLLASAALKTFLNENKTREDFATTPDLLATFAQLDDYDIWFSIKSWQEQPDKVLTFLANSFTNRQPFRIHISDEPFSPEIIEKIEQETCKAMQISKQEAAFLVTTGELTNSAYISGKNNIEILTKSGEIIDVAQASDLPNIKAMSQVVRKYFLCYPKFLPAFFQKKGNNGLFTQI